MDSFIDSSGKKKTINDLSTGEIKDYIEKYEEQIIQLQGEYWAKEYTKEYRDKINAIILDLKKELEKR